MVNVLLKAETYKNLKYKLTTPWLTRLQEAQKGGRGGGGGGRLLQLTPAVPVLVLVVAPKP
jgi:hypothetical protein